MTTATVTGPLADPSGSPLGTRDVLVQLVVGLAATGHGTTAEIVDEFRFTTDIFGQFSVDLELNSEIDPLPVTVDGQLVGGTVWWFRSGDASWIVRLTTAGTYRVGDPTIQVADPSDPNIRWMTGTPGPPGTPAVPGAWHTVGNSGEPAFLNSWVNYGAPYGPARFRLEAAGTVVRLSGTVITGASGTVVFTLPTGCRPLAPMLMIIIDYGSSAYVTVGTDGTVTVTAFAGSVTSGAWLDGVTFPIT